MADKVEEENKFMHEHEIVGDGVGDGADQVRDFVDPDLRFETRNVCVARSAQFCHLTSAYRAHFVR